MVFAGPLISVTIELANPPVGRFCRDLECEAAPRRKQNYTTQ
jgi:hypothetical protein